MQSSEKMEELESVRGIAALMVVLYHLPKWCGFFDFYAVNNFYLMVDFFFVLSGFVMYRAYGNKLQTMTEVLRFQFLRFGRLYPVHLIFLAAFVGLELARLYASSRGMLMNAQPFPNDSPVWLIQHLLLVQALPPHSAPTFNGPSWSISVEFYTYLLFGAISLFSKRWVPFIFAAIASIAIGVLAAGQSLGMESLLRCFAGFFVGCLTVPAYYRLRNLNTPGLVPLLPIVALAFYLTLQMTASSKVFIYALSVMLILSLLCSRQGTLRQALRSRLLVYLGTLSYSIYMAHYILIALFEIVLNRVLHFPAGIKPGGGYIAVLNVWQAALAYIVFFALLVILGEISYRLIEKPCREASRRFAWQHGADKQRV